MTEKSKYTPDWFRKKSFEEKYKDVKAKADKEREEFLKDFGPEVLKSLSGKELLLKIFKGPKSLNNDYLVNVLEVKTKTFGSGNLGNAHNAGVLYKDVVDGKWEEASWAKRKGQNAEPITENEAIWLAEGVRDAIVKSIDYLSGETLDSVEAYGNAEKTLKSYFEKLNPVFKHNYIWIVKYFQMVKPDLFPVYYNNDWSDHIISKIGTETSDTLIKKLGSIALYIKKCNIDNVTFSSIFFDEFGKPDKNIIVKSKVEKPIEYKISYSKNLIESKNIIFRGAPGTGKTYLAKEIAADIISGGLTQKYDELSAEQKEQIEFVQFHPSYDYSDFVEGLRPRLNDDGSMGFELQDGIFKRFVSCARKNYENSQKTEEVIQVELSVQEMISNFVSNIELGETTFKTINGREFVITNVYDDGIDIYIPDNLTVKYLKLNIDELTKMLSSDTKFTKVKDITDFFGKKYGTQQYSYDFAIYKAIKAQKSPISKKVVKPEELKKYIFIIDEINRGEISKIFGELFYSIDPGYRGKSGEVSTQYSSLHKNKDEKFYIPENVYIIGTMNDIDRSVDSFDFAMRRRFRFINIKANEHMEMLSVLDDNIRSKAENRMKSLNKAILNVEGLNENYQIGASYFLKLKELSFEQLWSDYLEPLLQDYIQGMYEEKEIMKKLADAYENETGAADESAEN